MAAAAGRMLLIDLDEGRIVEDEEIKSNLAAEHPYGDWLRENSVQPRAISLPSARNDRAERTEDRSQRARRKRSATPTKI